MISNKVAVSVCVLLSISFGFTQSKGNPREIILSDMNITYNTMLNQPGKDYYIQLNELLRLEKELYKENQCVEYFGFINENKAKEIVLKSPDKNRLLRELSNYEYDTAVTVNNALYAMFLVLRSQSTDTVFVQQVTEKMLDFAVKVTPHSRNISKYEISENSWYYNQASINKLLRIVKKEYTEAEKITSSIYWARQFDYTITIQSELGKIYIKDLKNQVSNKKRREKKSRDMSYEKLKSLYPELNRDLHDSLFSINAKEGVERLYEKDVSQIIYTLGKIYASNTVFGIESILTEQAEYNKSELYMAKIALARLGVQKYEDMFLKEEQPKAGELIYICSQASAYRFAELMKDTTISTGCFAWSWELLNKDYKELKIPSAYKYLWILNRTKFIQISTEDEWIQGYDFDDYCAFYSLKKEKEECLKKAIKWLDEKKGDYILNPHAHDYDLRY